jgi:hypothetical protein
MRPEDRAEIISLIIALVDDIDIKAGKHLDAPPDDLGQDATNEECAEWMVTALEAAIEAIKIRNIKEGI